jgi:uncharacterized protein YbgA (DUF1722 family)
MRIWDINPGYLNRQSLLGEHRELHGIVSIIVNGKKGYSKHPETLRWVGHDWALRMRHQLLGAEMALRNFTDRTPVVTCINKGVWPGEYIDEPGQQFKILEDKYKDKEQGRIPLPKNAQQLWSQHKYSVMARDVNIYKQFGKQVSAMPSTQDFSAIAKALAELLRMPPTMGGIKNALHHMWGYVSNLSDPKHDIETWSLNKLFNEMQSGVLRSKEPYLMASTALSELKAWIENA